MKKCEICQKEFGEGRGGFSQHLILAHNKTLVEYSIEYDKFKIPLCGCGEVSKLKNGLTFRSTCGKPQCKSKNRSESQTKRFTAEEERNKIRKTRIEWLRKNPEKTAWRLGNKMSWPELKFLEALKFSNLDSKYLIIREFCQFPYYIDFAFVNEKVAVEIDGSQHLTKTGIKRDLEKDNVLLENGWKIFRIPAAQLYSSANDVVIEVEKFIGMSLSFGKCGVKTHKEIKAEEKQKKQDLKIKTKNEILQKLLDLDFTGRGAMNEASNILNIGPSSVRRYLRRVFPDFYAENCKFGSHKTKIAP